MIKELLNQNPLFVFALESEALNLFEEYKPLFVGVGKINAAYHLTKRINQEKPSIIVNLGSAGSNIYPRGSIVCCTKFVQRDMDVRMLGYNMYETPFSTNGTILDYGISIDCLEKGICGTGDSFEVNHSTNKVYNVIDMEAYSLAYIAKQEAIPFLCLKYISDGADDNAALEWTETVQLAGHALKNAINHMTNTSL